MNNEQSTMNNQPIQICILGGGFGGLYTALYLSNFSWLKAGRCQITLVEKKEHFLFTPLLYEILTGELERWEIAPSYQKLLATTKINFCQSQIQSINLDNKQVTLAEGEQLSYDYLVLAVGTQTRFANIPGVVDHTLSFRTIADAEYLQEKLRILELSERQRLSIAIIGGGPNGVELSCKLADRLEGRGKVVLLERGDKILKGFSSGVKRAAHRALQSRNIQVKLATNIKAIAPDSITISYNEEIITLSIDLVLWTAGTKPLELVRNLAKSNSQGKLLTLPTLQLVDYSEVFALGDLADIRNQNKPVPATAQAAYQQAACSAKNIKAAIINKRLRHFRYLHLGDMLTLGKGAAIVSSFFLNIEGSLAAIIRRLIYIQRLPTLRHRLQVFKNLLKRSILSKK